MRETSSFAEYLRELLAHRGLKAAQVAAYAEISPTVFTNWLRGAKPKPESLAKVAPFLRVTVDDLMRAAGYLSPAGASAGPSTVVTMPDIDREEAMRRLMELAMPGFVRRIPIQEGWAHAGEGAVEHQFVYAPPGVAGENLIAIRVRGTCMEPAVRPGDVVIVDLDSPPLDGDLVAVNADGKVMIRIFDADAQMLRANDGSEPIVIESADAIAPIVGIYKAARAKGR